MRGDALRGAFGLIGSRNRRERFLSIDDRPSCQLLVSSGFAMGPQSDVPLVYREPQLCCALHQIFFDELALPLFKRIQFLLHRLLKAVP